MNRQGIIYLKQVKNKHLFRIGYSAKNVFIHTEDVVAAIETNDYLNMKRYIRTELKKTYESKYCKTDEILTDDLIGIKFHFYNAAHDYYATKTLTILINEKK